MPSRIDITGQRFSRLTVIEQVGRKHNRPLWKCLCDCGNEVYVLAGNLRRGQPRSCGCIRTKHGCSHSKKQNVSREYRSWNGARNRCRNPKDKSFQRYGGRGISFSEKWDDFAVFLTDMGECPPGLTLDRIDNDGNYEPGNCRWTTHREQSANRRNTQRYEFDGCMLTRTEMAERLKVSNHHIDLRLAAGDTIEMIRIRAEQGAWKKKLWHRAENSRASKFTPEAVAGMMVEHKSLPRSGSRVKPGAMAALADKHGISKERLYEIVKGKTNWSESEAVKSFLRAENAVS